MNISNDNAICMIDFVEENFIFGLKASQYEYFIAIFFPLTIDYYVMEWTDVHYISVLLSSMSTLRGNIVHMDMGLWRATQDSEV